MCKCVENVVNYQKRWTERLLRPTSHQTHSSAPRLGTREGPNPVEEHRQNVERAEGPAGVPGLHQHALQTLHQEVRTALNNQRSNRNRKLIQDVNVQSIGLQLTDKHTFHCRLNTNRPK